MSDQEKKISITPRPNAENKKDGGELSEEELKKVAGGAPTAAGQPVEYLKITMTNTTVSN
jgi:hypothetical protein